MYFRDMKYGLFTFLILLFSCVCSGQDYLLLGVVKDAETGEPLLGAVVTACAEAAVTDASGEFQLQIQEKVCPVEISYLGYENFSDTLDLPLEDGEIFIAFLTRSSDILNQAVITASKYALRQSESTVSLQVLAPQAISSSNVSSIDDVLENLPGVDVLDGQANIRGGSGYAYGVGSRVLLMTDDIASLQYDGGNSHWDDVPQEAIQQIEVLKGASSVLYGTSALNGVIHFRTIDAPLVPRVQASISSRYFLDPEDERRKWWTEPRYEVFGNVLYARKIKKLDLVTSWYGNQLESYNEETTRSVHRVFAKLKYGLSPKSKVHVNIQYNGGERSSFFYWANALRGAYRPANGTLTVSNNRRFMIDPGWTYYDEIGNKHTIKGRLFYANNANNNDQSVLSFSQNLNYEFTTSLLNGDVKWISGFQGLSNTTNSELYGNSSFLALNGGVYSQWSHKIIDPLNYTVGVRYEFNQLQNDAYTYELDDETVLVDEKVVSEGKPVFRAGLNYSPFKGTYFRSSIGQGYRFPTIAEKFTITNAGGLIILPNPELEAETGFSSEIGVRQEFKNFFISSFLDAAMFYSEYNNMIEYQLTDNADGFRAENVGDTRIPGVEISWGTQWDVGKLKIQTLLGYTHINPTYKNFTEEIKFSGTSEENILKYRYRNSVKSGVTVQLYNIELWVNQRFNSHMVSIDRNFSTFINGIAAFRELYSDGYNVLDARVAYKFKRFSIGLNMNNILNATYTERPALLEAPRNISLRFTYDTL